LLENGLLPISSEFDGPIAAKTFVADLMLHTRENTAYLAEFSKCLVSTRFEAMI
jgi:hypothetical protein